MLNVSSLSSSYGRLQVLFDVDIEVGCKEIVSLIGANGAGKSTLLNTLSGLHPAQGGHINLFSNNIDKLKPEKRLHMGMVLSPEGRRIFTNMSVLENLRLGAYIFSDPKINEDLEMVYGLFPVLFKKRDQIASGLSGGQQQMLAIARALMGRPKLLLLDEPSLGLAPILVKQVFGVIKSLKKKGISVLLVEQNAYASLSISDRAYVLESGRISLSGSASEMLRNPKVREAYLGI